MQTFKDLGLQDETLRAITELGFKEPTPIQAEAIPAILSSQEDLIALAQTGTGKTAAFGLPTIEKTDTQQKIVQTLILCPTRELCLQISKDLAAYSKYLKALKVSAVYGGTSISAQIRDLKSGVHIVVGTPGRTLDLISRGALKVQDIKHLILDEADEMLNMGFKDELDAILSATPKEKQTLLFSATMPKEVKRLSNEYMNKANEITVGTQNMGADTVSHLYYTLRETDRYLVLKRLADMNPKIFGIVFCRTRKETQDVAEHLMKDGYNADALHGDLSQSQRDYVMQRFRSKSLQLLIATDVAARGLDVNELTHVINYKLPDDPEAYIHRSGRTGRAGHSGVSIALINMREKRKIAHIERTMNKKFQQAAIPTGREVCERQLLNLANKLADVEVNENEVGAFLPVIMKNLSHLDREDLIKKFVSLEFNHFLNYYRNAKDLNAIERAERKSDRSDRESRGSRKELKFNSFSINLGKKHNINPSYLIGIINEVSGDSSIQIGRIDVQENSSFLDIDSAHAEDLTKAFQGIIYNDVNLHLKNLGKSGSSHAKKSRNDRRGGGNRRNEKGGAGYKAGAKHKRGGSKGGRGRKTYRD